jgi:hypothetical protein
MWPVEVIVGVTGMRTLVPAATSKVTTVLDTAGTVWLDATVRISVPVFCVQIPDELKTAALVPATASAALSAVCVPVRPPIVIVPPAAIGDTGWTVTVIVVAFGILLLSEMEAWVHAPAEPTSNALLVGCMNNSSSFATVSTIAALQVIELVVTLATTHTTLPTLSVTTSAVPTRTVASAASTARVDADEVYPPLLFTRTPVETGRSV